jgi:hypothetical protein
MSDWKVAARFLEQLKRRSKGRRKLLCSPENLLAWYDTAFPTESGCQDARSRIRRLLDTLAETGAIALPKGDAGWLPFPPPKLPNWIKFPAPARSAKDQRHKTYPWGPELSFLASLPSVPHLDVLVAINTWLRDGGRDTDIIVPLRERSIQITHDEKALDAVIRCQTLQPQPGKGVTLGLLKSYRAPPPLAYECGGEGTEGRPVLVIENAHTWYSFANWNRTARRYAAVVYGNGSYFAASVPHLRSIIAKSRAAQEVRYFGDLDEAGLSIPVWATEVAWEEDLPPPQPEEWLYTELLKYPSQKNTGKPCDDETSVTSLVAWLPEHLRNPVRTILGRGERIAQERVGTSFLAAEHAQEDETARRS